MGDGADKQVQSEEGAAEAEVVDVAAEVESLKAELAARVKVQEDLQAQLKGAKSQEDFDKLSADYAEQMEALNRQLVHTSVMARFGFDSELSEFVFGDTEQEMVARAEKLRQRLGSVGGPATNRSGGGARGAGVGDRDSLPDDPGKLADLFPRNGLIG